jgi:hypothetical protein
MIVFFHNFVSTFNYFSLFKISCTVYHWLIKKISIRLLDASVASLYVTSKMRKTKSPKRILVDLSVLTMTCPQFFFTAPSFSNSFCVVSVGVCGVSVKEKMASISYCSILQSTLSDFFSTEFLRICDSNMSKTSLSAYSRR